MSYGKCCDCVYCRLRDGRAYAEGSMAETGVFSLCCRHAPAVPALQVKYDEKNPDKPLGASSENLFPRIYDLTVLTMGCGDFEPFTKGRKK